MSARANYQAAVSSTRRHASLSGPPIDYRELIRLGSLAASSHNTQPWTFTPENGRIRIEPDYSRRCPVVDPDDAHLFRSLGCAAENIVHAAAAIGLRADIDINAAAAVPAVTIHLVADPDCRATELADAITSRQCTKAPYDGHPIDQDHLAALAPAEPRYGVRTIVLTDTAAMQPIVALVERGNRAQLTDPAFRDELLSWIRPNDHQSLASGDGLSGRTMGSPSIPTWLAKRLLPLLVTAKRQVKTDTANIASSAGIAVFVTDGNNVSDWVNAGRCYERFALQATVLDICNAFINQPIEVPSLRPELEQYLGLGDEHAQLMVRFGTGTQMPFSPRRPLDDIINTASA